jgi:hypothetical protein
MKCRRNLLVVATAIAASFAPAAAQTTLSLNPKATFLRVNSDPGALNSSAHALAGLGLGPGGWCAIQQVGDWKHIPGATDTARSLLGIFSSSSTLLPATNLNRVPGAIGAGPAYVTANTFFGGVVTDVAADFRASANDPAPHSIYLRVPLGAQFVFFAPHDSYYQDNTDPDGDYGVLVTPVVAPILPGTSEDLVVASGVNGPATAGPGIDLKLAAAGDVLTLELTSPFGTADGGSVVYGLLLTFAAAPPVNYYGLPDLWIDPYSPAFLPLAPLFSPLPAGGIAFSSPVPPGLLGFGIIIQGAALTPLARNGLYVAADAHAVIFTS